MEKDKRNAEKEKKKIDRQIQKEKIKSVSFPLPYCLSDKKFKIIASFRGKNNTHGKKLT